MSYKSYEEALECGDKRYTTGEPCKNGHEAPRYVSSKHCTECQRLRTLKYGRKKSSKEKARGARLLRVYGVEKSMVDAHNHCEICNTKLEIASQSKNGKCVDHCHETGAFRGILCNHCNRALGLFVDNVSTLNNAISYLENWMKEKPK